MKKIISTTLLALFLSAGLVGCGDSIETAIKEQEFKDEIRICIEKGGVPIRTAWNNKRMGDCVFPPTAN
jgi:hypothetical protein